MSVVPGEFVCDLPAMLLSIANTSAKKTLCKSSVFMVTNSIFGRLADYKSAIQQVENLRYSTAMSQVAGVCE
jgi:hypothetical protein